MQVFLKAPLKLRNLPHHICSIAVPRTTMEEAILITVDPLQMCPESSPQVNDDYCVTDSKITSREVLSNCMPSPKQSGWGPPRDIEGEEYCLKLRAALAEKYDAKQLEELLASASCRKPVLRVRHMRGRTVDSVTENEGLSYLDHHPDLAETLANATKLEDKLSLLRGLFFWLQHSCMVGAFKPWLPPPPSQAPKEQNGDCFETNGPDCKVHADDCGPQYS
jgi:hypothetical protein